MIWMIAAFFADHFSISEQTKVDITPERLQSAEEDLEDWLKKDGVLFFIEEDGTEAGFCILARHGGTVVWIEDIFVKKELRCQGIASRAIGLAEAYARDVMKAPAVNLEVIPQNTAAIRLYRKLGYDTIPIFTMRKSITEEKRTNETEFLGHTFFI